MAEFELIMPKMGESIAEATITRWLKNEGDVIKLDEAVVEIATDKVDSEVPSTNEGILVKKLWKEGDVVPVGAAIAIIGSDASATASASAPAPAAVAQPRKEQPDETIIHAAKLAQQPLAASAQPATNGEAGRFYSPLVLNIARTEGISMAELEQIAGSGKENRVTKGDILKYIEGGRQSQSAAASPVPAQVKPATETAKSSPEAKPQSSKIALMPGDEIVEMDRMRKLIADHMVMSVTTSPHVTSYVEADVTNLVLWREKNKAKFEKKEGEKITFTPIFIEAVVKAIKDFPMINVSLDGYNVIKRKNINIGMAAALPSGNLIVPVIKNADTKNLLGLVKDVNDLARRARENKLQPDEIQGGTYTITNVGTFGNVMGTPIINQPQVAILAVGAIRKKPAVLETEFGDVIAIRHMMFLSHSYDHRVVDGALGGAFVRRVADYLEQWDVNREI
jgi:2-oxoglutarate dehydrogenase E2 component (dihydrolipoamide succinyltransferase)